MRWKLRKHNPLKAKKFIDELGISHILAKAFAGREISFADISTLLKSPELLLENPLAIPGAEEAARTIVEQAQKDDAEFWVFADYDVDGLTSGHVMNRILSVLVGEKNVHVYYPERTEGYGLNMEFVEAVISHKKKTERNIAVVTVDNGITKVAEIAKLQKNEIQCIVTDHHEPGDEYPSCPCCDAFLKKDGTGQHLCGAAIAWKVGILVRNIAKEIGVAEYGEMMEDLLPFVALGTIADVMPMTPENIAIVRIGLERLSDPSCKEAESLRKFAKIAGKPFPTAMDIAWEIAPKLNACGRMGNTAKAASLFEEKDPDKLHEAMLDILDIDAERKSLSKKAIEDARKSIEKEGNRNMVSFFNCSKYPAGINGIVAGKLADIFGKPAIVYQVDLDGTCSGSMRGVRGVDMFNILKEEECKGNVLSCGGHSDAAGVSFEDKMFFKLRDSLNDVISKISVVQEEEPQIEVDAVISLASLSSKTVADIEKFPYDKMDFHSPIVAVKCEVLSTHRSRNNENNICFLVKDEYDTQKEIWAWGKGTEYESLKKPKNIWLIGEIDRDFRNNKNVTMRIAGISSC